MVLNTEKADGAVNVRMPGHAWLPEPTLAFHPDRVEDQSSHPLDGLTRYGPYGQSVVSRLLGPIRVAVIAPAGGIEAMEGLLRELEGTHKPKERFAYLLPFPGFSRVFRIGLVRAASSVCIELPASLDEEVAASQMPHALLADRITRAISALATRRIDFDVLLIYLPDKWRAGFRGPEGDDFDLHDYLKAITAIQDVPTQIINEDGALAYYCRCSVSWRLGIALYCKAGGVPWKLAAGTAGTAYIGVSYALRSPSSDAPAFVTCCSQIFDADGIGLEFIAYSPEEVEVQEGVNPFLSRGEMRRVMARSLGLFQRRHGGESPKRVVVHKTTEFKPDEMAGCFDALKASEGIDLVQVQQDTPWRGILIDAPPAPSKKASPASYPLLRGTHMPLGTRETLLWTQGDAPDAVGGRHFFKEGKGIPAPLLLRRFGGHGSWEANCQDVLNLTKMNWNSDSLYDRMPVTLAFAQTLARIIKRMDRLGNRAFQFRLFI